MAEAREQVGPDFPLRLDCYMALTVPVRNPTCEGVSAI
jgi:L-alanine-DL-glutamate epimerase-like enolase superfamily enzyme